MAKKSEKDIGLRNEITIRAPFFSFSLVLTPGPSYSLSLSLSRVALGVSREISIDSDVG